jgi:hypothetical protein
MYLAGLIADDARMTKKDLQRWVDQAYCLAIGGCTVAWVTAEGEHGWEMALKWIDAKKENVASAGWSTLCSLVALTDDAALDVALLKKLLQRIATTIHQQPNDVRSTMNHFVISLGSYVKALTNDAVSAAKDIGEVFVDVGDTACKVPDAATHIMKVKAKGALGKKRKTVKC